MAIDYIVIAKEWRDKINGNSYFSARIENTVENKVYALPYQYGYGDQYKHEAIKRLQEEGEIVLNYRCVSDLPIKFIKIPNCKKRDTVEYGKFSIKDSYKNLKELL
tara:strand:+ start:3082 stop:3399 length:318 start_codon:yes stop_codon:yes gene_type:complete